MRKTKKKRKKCFRKGPRIEFIDEFAKFDGGLNGTIRFDDDFYITLIYIKLFFHRSINRLFC